MTSTTTERPGPAALAVEQARIGWSEGGIPIGAALVHRGEVLAVGPTGGSRTGA